jgi:hypothetical protein
LGEVLELLSREWSFHKRACCGVDLVSGHEENIYLLLPRFQGSCKVTAENGSEKRLIVNGEMPCFFLILVDGLSMDSMLFSKSSLRNFYNAF